MFFRHAVRAALIATLLLSPILAMDFFAGRFAAAQEAEVGAPARELLDAAAQKLLDADSVKFKLDYEKGSTKLYTGIKMRKADGAIVRPDRMKVTVEAKLGFIGIDVNATIIGDQVWVKAVGIDDNFQVSDEVAELIYDPVHFIPTLATAIVDPVVQKIETKDDQTLTWISGTFDPALVEDEDIADYAESVGVRPVEVAIDDQGRIASVRMAGKFIDQDSKDVIRRIDLYDYDVPVEITEP